MNKNLLLIGLLVLLATNIFGQAANAYISPMDIPLVLSGNFGEMRRNHFHTGIDIKTQGRQGIPIKAIAEGYVSRIKVSPYGYGNALYIAHPDGNTSVYAHLREFSDSISDLMRYKQYEEKAWELDYFPEPYEIEVKKGEIIGLSGNSGSSSGPHLHFEIRESLSEHPLNPLNFGFEVKDDRKPEIKGIRVYPLNRDSQVQNKQVAKSFVAIADKTGQYGLAASVVANGELGLAIHTFDRMTGTGNKYGIYRLEMKVDGMTHYSHVMDELDFDNFRQVNCHKDHELYHLNRWRYHKSFPAENNTLEIYELLVDGGRLNLNQGDTLQIEFIASDIVGNHSTIAFQLIGGDALEQSWPEEEGVLLDASTDNVFTVEGLAVRFPLGRIYEDFYLRPSIKPRPDDPSDLYYLNDRDIPLDNEISISMYNRNPPSDWKYTVAEHTDYRGRVQYLKGRMNDGWYEIGSKYLGAYRLVEDRNSPRISSEYSSKTKKLSLSLDDNLSGIDSLSVEVDGRWLRMAYNAAMTRAWGSVSELNLNKGTHDLRIYARDLAGNEVIEIKKITR